MKFLILSYLFFTFALGTLGQDSVTYCIQGRVRDEVKEKYIEGAIIDLVDHEELLGNAKSDSLGNYAIGFRSIAHQKNCILEVSAKGFLYTGCRIVIGDDSLLHYDFDLRPLKVYKDVPFPDHFLFDAQSSNVNREDSLWLAQAFSMMLSGEMGLSYSYVIEVRRSSDESNDIALNRGSSLKKLLVQMGVDPDRIVIDNLSTSDFYFFDSSSDSVFAVYLNERGLEVTQDLIDKTTDPITREAYESMRRFAKIKIDLTKR